jgi:hypothetical protein
MLRRWLDMAVARPELLADHAGAWAQFLAAEWTPAWRAQQRLVLLWALALLSGGTGLLLGGVALMLAVVTPPGQLALWPTQGVLWLVPLLPLLLSLACVMAARHQPKDGTWTRVTRQWEADRALWRQAGAE